MPQFEFTIEATGPLDDDGHNALFEAGCDDCSIETDRSGERHTFHFHRDADSLAQAVASAIHDIHRAGCGLVLSSDTRSTQAAG